MSALSIRTEQREALGSALEALVCGLTPETRDRMLDTLTPLVADMLAGERERVAREIEAHRKVAKADTSVAKWKRMRYASGLTAATRIARAALGGDENEPRGQGQEPVRRGGQIRPNTSEMPRRTPPPPSRRSERSPDGDR